MKRLLLIGILGGLAGCGDPVGTPVADPPPVAEAPAPVEVASAPKPAQPSGPPIKVAPAEEQAGPASVNKIETLTGDAAKFYSVAGGDPAVNGMVTYLAVSGGPAEGWKTFQIGDFNDWQIVEQAKGRVVLKVNRSTVDPTSGQIKTGDALLIVGVPAFAVDEVTVTPAS